MQQNNVEPPASLTELDEVHTFSRHIKSMVSLTGCTESICVPPGLLGGACYVNAFTLIGK